MKKIIYLLSIAILMPALFTGCGEEFLEVKPQSTVTEGNFYENETEISQALTAVYDVIGWVGLFKRTSFVVDIASDNSTQIKPGASNEDYMIEFDNFNVQPNNLYTNFRWDDCWTGIYRANVFLSKIEDFEDMDPALKERYIAEASALRAMFYLTLVTTFGDLPIITSLLSAEEFNSISRSPKAEVYDLIVQDLEFAASVLPEKPDYDQPDTGRVTKGAANAWLGRVLLYTENWAESAARSKAVIESGHYGLFPGENWENNFNYEGENGIESVFEIQNVSGFGGIWGNSGENLGLNKNWAPIYGFAQNHPTADFANSFEPGDIRREKSLFEVGDLWDPKGDGVLVELTNQNNASETDYNIKKYVTHEDEHVRTGINYRVTRYAEVLLNYAEALHMQGNTPEAIPYLNQVRTRAGLAPIDAGDDFFEALMQERRHEFAFELEFRFLDLVRWDKAEEILGPLGFRKGIHEVWPIPQTEIDTNPNLKQNNGY